MNSSLGDFCASDCTSAFGVGATSFTAETLLEVLSSFEVKSTVSFPTGVLYGVLTGDRAHFEQRWNRLATLIVSCLPRCFFRYFGSQRVHCKSPFTCSI